MFQIGELSRRTGVHIETIRYYERIALMPTARRGQNRFRYYDEAQAIRLNFIRRARELGFSLDEVRSLLGLSETPDAACADVERLAATHLDDVRSKLADLRRLEAQLVEALRQCQIGQAANCPLLDSLAQVDGAS